MIVTVSFHAERLHEDAVWARVAPILEGMARRGQRATLFVEPVRARLGGLELRDRLDRATGYGHEVAMHTHFYELLGPPGRTSGFRKPSLFTDDNVRRCLDEDLAYLRSLGHTPRGFVAGGWAISPTTFAWLDEHSFTYDSSCRTFHLSYDNPQAAAGEEVSEPRRIGGVLELPTTAPLSAAVASHLLPMRRSPAVLRPLPYQHIYLHDYDLLGRRRLASLQLLLRLLRQHDLITVSELVGLIAPLVASG